MLRNLVLSAAAAGLAAGLFTAALQHVTTTPLILAAERYEIPETAGVALADAGVTSTHDGAAHAGEPAPTGGWERTLQTSLATIVMGVGFALALLGVMVAAGGRIDAANGLAFGVAGFAAAALAPALGLPPEIPGSAAAGLAERQVWWWFAALATGAGLAGILLTRGNLAKAGGLALIAFPHLVGAPRADAYSSMAPAELAAEFAAASLVVAAVFWSLLGYASGAFYQRLSRSG